MRNFGCHGLRQCDANVASAITSTGVTIVGDRAGRARNHNSESHRHSVIYSYANGVSTCSPRLRQRSLPYLGSGESEKAYANGAVSPRPIEGRNPVGVD